MSDPCHIVAEGLGRRFGSVQALHDLSVRIPAGTIVGLVGRNGAGKSTFLRLCAGLIPATSGQLRIGGREPWLASTSQRQGVAMVLQDQRLPPRCSLRDVGVVMAACYPTWKTKRFADLLDRFRLPSDAGVATLSGGQQRLAAAALCLSSGAPLLLLDEPAAGLDPLARRDLVETLLEVADDGGTTVLYSTHLLADLEKGAASLLVMEGGACGGLIEVGSFQERFRRIQVVLPDGLDGQRLPLPALSERCDLGPVISGIHHGDPAAWDPVRAIPGVRVIEHPVSLEDAYILHQRAIEESRRG